MVIQTSIKESYACNITTGCCYAQNHDLFHYAERLQRHKCHSSGIIQYLSDKKYDLEVEEILCSAPTSSLDLNGKQYEMTKKAINKVFPGVEIIPYVVTGGTDSRFYDGKVDASVRFEPINTSKDQLSRMHGIDENIDINTLPLAVDYYKEIIRLQEGR